jgi:DNA-binding transcriptional regulator YhcF (GntR family)
LKLLKISKEEQQRWADTAARPLLNDYVKRMKELGLPGDEVLKFVQTSLKQHRQQ